MRNTNTVFRLGLMLGYTGIAALMLACAAIGVGSSTIAQNALQLDDGMVKMQDENGDLKPLAGSSTFELVGTLESLDPPTVAGRVLQRNDATEIADELETGDLVRARGAIVDDKNWLAYSMEPAEESTQNQTITLIGRVESVDPWVVNGITLHVTPDTVIAGEITTNMLV